MGIRGLWGFRTGQKDKLTYCGFNSYPDGLGQTMIDFIKQNDDEKLLEIANKIVLVSNEVKPTQKQFEECQKLELVRLDASEHSEEDWYCLLRNSQGDPFSYEGELTYMIDSHTFLEDSLFCEYAYIINLDTKELEYYVGYNKSGGNSGRYEGVPNSDGYYPCRYAMSVTFDTIRTGDENEIINEMNNFADA